MDALDVDYLIVYASLLITLVIGLWAGRGIKDIREYALANKMFGTAALVLTFLATDIGGQAVINIAGEVSRTGIIMPVALLGIALGFIIQGIFITPKISYFDQCITMGDLMGALYGDGGKIITGILGFFTTICVVGMELTVLGIVCESLLGFDYRWGIGIGSLVLAIYSAHGGIKAVTVTDIFQFLILLLVLPILAGIALKRAGGIKLVFTSVPTTKFLITNHPDFSYYLTIFLSFSVFFFNIIDPAAMQRFLMGKSERQLRNQCFTLAGFYAALLLTIMLLGLAGVVLYPELESTNIVPHIIKDCLPLGIKGLAITGILMVIMSTVDSYLHAAGLTLVHDVIKLICDKKNIAINELRWVRYTTFLIGLIAIIIGFVRADDLYGFVFTSFEFTGPILMFPLLSGIMGLAPSKTAFYVAAGITLPTFIVAKMLLPETQSHLSVFISVLVNGIVFFGIHVMHNRGFAFVSRGERYTEENLWKPRGKAVAAYYRQFIPTPQRIIRYSQKKIEKYDAPYILFGVFCCINFTLPYFMWDHNSPNTYNLMLYLRTMGALACGLLVVQEKWPKGLLPYLPTFWHLTLLYCLPFTSTMMFLLTQGSVEWLINVALTIMFLIVLVDWMSFIILTSLGVALGFFFYQTAIGPIDLQLDFSTGYLLVYQGIFATLIGLLFARRKQKSFDTLATQREQLFVDNQEAREELWEANAEQLTIVNELRKAGIGHLAELAQLSKELAEESKALDTTLPIYKKAQQLRDKLTPMALHLDRLEHRTTGFLLLEGVERVTVDQFLQDLQQTLYDRGHKLKIVLRTQHASFQCDVEKMKKVLVNSLTLLQAVAGEGENVLLGIEDTRLGYPLEAVAAKHTKQVDGLRFTMTTASDLPKREELYMSQMGEKNMMQPATTADLPLLANERIIKAHYGYSSMLSAGKELILVYVIPVNVREVRSKDMDTPQMKLGAAWPRADDSYPGAQQQEKAFLQAVKERSKADLVLVEKAINLLKDYHGPVMRQRGEPFYLHPIAVAQIVLDYNQEEATILGALLHDTVEDTPLTLEQVALLFSKEVSSIVAGVTHMESDKDTLYKVQLSHPENIHRLLGAEDKRVLYVKLADRMHNMRTIQAKSHKSQRRTAEETLLFFVPLAKYLGLIEAAEELKNRSFEVLKQ